VGDPVIAAIDRVYDLVDVVVDRADRVLDRVDRMLGRVPGAAVASKPSPRRRRAATPDAGPVSGAALVTTKKSLSFRLVEAVDAVTGAPVFIVTNGVQRAELATREMAVKCLAMLEAAV
jgi:hypothetical protein